MILLVGGIAAVVGLSAGGRISVTGHRSRRRRGKPIHTEKDVLLPPPRRRHDLPFGQAIGGNADLTRETIRRTPR